MKIEKLYFFNFRTLCIIEKFPNAILNSCGHSLFWGKLVLL